MKKIFSILIALMMVGCSQPSDDGNGPQKPSEPVEFKKFADEDEVKVMSFNIRTDSSSDGTNGWSYRKSACVEMIKDQKPTIIGFQEAQFTLQWSYMKDIDEVYITDADSEDVISRVLNALAQKLDAILR